MLCLDMHGSAPELLIGDFLEALSFKLHFDSYCYIESVVMDSLEPHLVHLQVMSTPLLGSYAR